MLATDGPRRLEQAGEALATALQPRFGQRLPDPLPDAVVDALVLARGRVDEVQAGLRAIDTGVGEANQRKVRAQKAATTLTEHLDQSLAVREGFVAFVAGTASAPRLEVAPIEVDRVLAPLWDKRTAVLTSATIPLRLPERLGLPADRTDVLDVGSPFDYGEQALLYCAAHLPDPRNAAFPEQSHLELEALIAAAGGRTLALFTSWRAMQAAADALRPKLTYTVLTQSDLPKPELLAAFAREESSCLFATAGLFQGIDVPGPSLSLVTIDRLPFPRPDDPLLQARRERRRCRVLQPHRPPPRHHAAGPGRRPAHPQLHRPRRGGRPRPAAGQGRLPLGRGAGPAADAAHAPPRRGRGLPPIDHRAMRLGIRSP